jgi:dimethylargininase
MLPTAHTVPMTIQSQTAPLRRVYVRPPVAPDLDAWSGYGWRSAPDVGRAIAEHDAFRETLANNGAEVIVGETAVPGDPDAIYAYDPVLLCDQGAILLRPGKLGRRDEPAAVAKDLSTARIAIFGELMEPAVAEGGDMFWLDETTLLVGRGYRTNDDGIRQLRDLLTPPGVQVLGFDLPHLHGPDSCLHLMSLISPLAVDLAVVYLPLMPAPLVELLCARGIAFVEVPEEEFDSMGPNVLALGPRLGLALDGNLETRRRMEAAGVDVLVYVGDEISRKGDGGPTCLTRPLERG